MSSTLVTNSVKHSGFVFLRAFSDHALGFPQMAVAWAINVAVPYKQLLLEYGSRSVGM